MSQWMIIHQCLLMGTLVGIFLQNLHELLLYRKPLSVFLQTVWAERELRMTPPRAEESKINEEILGCGNNLCDDRVNVCHETAFHLRVAQNLES